MRQPRLKHLAATLGVAVAALGFAGSASARTIDLYTHQPTVIDGFESTAGTLCSVTSLSVNQTSGNVFVLDACRNEGSITQFAPDGTPQPFSGAGGDSSISIKATNGVGLDVEVDNSGTSSDGNIYGLNGAYASVFKGFKSDGTALGGSFPVGGFREACGLAVDPQGNIWVANAGYNEVIEYTSVGVATGNSFPVNRPCHIAIDAQGDFYITERYGSLNKYDSEGNFLFPVNGFPTPTFGVTVDRSTGKVYAVETNDYVHTHVEVYSPSGEPLTAFGEEDVANSFPGLETTDPMGIDIKEDSKLVYVSNPRNYGGRQHIEVFKPTSTAVVPTTTTEPPALAPTQVTLKGSVDLDGAGDTTDCHFEWGTPYAFYEHSLPCNPASPLTGAGVHEVTAELPGLKQGTIYHYRIVTKNANGILSAGADRAFRPQGPATVAGQRASEVNTDGARISADIDPNGGDTTYRVEYGPEDCAVSTCVNAPAGKLKNPLGVQSITTVLAGLSPGSAYHYRVVATNGFGDQFGPDEILHTFTTESEEDRCGNAFVRKQVESAQLPDCRAYELASAAYAGGYDVRSDIVTGQVPFAAQPRAKDSVLYSLNYGKVPGISGEPTNLGFDPYVARRTADGWQTEYVGINVSAPPEQGPFGSAPSSESSSLSTVAFQGPGICSPCFADGKTGIPVHRPDGTLVQGMAGSMNPGPGATPDGYVGQQLSGDGSHLVFGSTSQFEPDGNTNGDVSIYDRDLNSGVTHVVSKAPNGSNLSCLQGAGTCHSPGNADGIGELGISEDGSRVVVAQLVSTDATGNHYWHPYMDIDGSSNSVDLAPGTAGGVIYDGMTSDGSAVFYTSADKLTGDDHDASPDIFKAAVSSSGTVTVTRVSTGSGAGDTDACDPVADGGRNNWNAVGSASANGCGAVAFAGGAGVATGSGTIYFLSPEMLDGSNGTLNQPNLYAAASGASPRFVATLEPGNPAIGHAVTSSSEHLFSDIQVTPSGNFAAFSSSLALTGYPNFEHTSIFRYSLPADTLDCASCAPTGAYETAETRLSQFGSNLTDDGRVFFTSREPLALRDSGSTADVYEWNQGNLSLISTGRSASDAGLVTVTSDGVNAFFYTRDTLVSGDRNADAVKIYDAREGGGFATAPRGGPCQASDECHGPGTTAPTTDQIGTFKGTGGNFKSPSQKKHRKHHKRKRHNHKKRHTTSKARRAR